MNKEKTKNLKENKKKIFLIVALSIILIASITCLVFAYKINNNPNKNLLYSYNIGKSTDYKVNLYENSFIEKDYLTKGETYISDLVKNIDTTLNYNFVSSKKLDLKYTYNVKATIVGEYQNSSNEKSSKVWKKDFVLVEEKNESKEQTTNFTINEKPNIDFPLYNNAVSEFRKNLKLPINASLEVVMNVKVLTTDEDGNDKLLDDSNVNLNIPLNKQAFSITTDIKDNESKNVYGDSIKEENNILLYISILLFILDMVIFTLNFKEITVKTHVKSKYKSDLNKILKTYGDVVVEIVNPVKTKLSGVIDVKNFNEMIDLEEELRTPILFYEIPGRDEGWFTIIHQEILYRYVLKDSTNTKGDENNSNKRRNKN